MNLGSALERGIAIGGLWGFVEVSFVYLSGSAPSSEAVLIMLAPLTVLVSYQLLILGLSKVRAHALFDLLAAAGVLIPPALLFLRGRGQRAPMSLVFGLLPCAFALLLVLRDRRRRTDGEGLTPWRIVAILGVCFGAVAACSLRASRMPALAQANILTAGLWCGALAVAGAAAVAMAKRRSTPAIFAVIVAGSFAVAWTRGTEPPSYKGPAIRSTPSGPAKGSPNVLLIVLDTVRADHLDLYGHSRPTFALTGRYLKDGLVFDSAVATGTFSLTSHGSLFTGQLPSAHGARPTFGSATSYGRLRPEVQTLAAFLRSKGYRTAGVSANDIFLAEWTGLQAGFDTFSATSGRNVRFTTLSTLIQRRFAPRRRGVPAATTWTAAQITNAAIDLVGQEDEPYFLFLNYFDAHGPRAARGSPPWFNAATAREVDVYDTLIAGIDAEVARLLRTLEQRGGLDNTLVIVTADHGEYFGERKLRGHPAAPFEPGLHVPLALRLPGVVAPGRTQRRTGLHEVFQMVRDVLARRSLDWVLEPDATPRILAEAWARGDRAKGGPVDGRPSTTVVYSGSLKLVHRLSGRHELYDLATDPGEERNLIDSKDPGLVAAKDRLLREVDLRPMSPAGAVRPLSEEALERLRALGYLR